MTGCVVCSELGDREHAAQKYGSEDNTHLPAAFLQLLDVFDFQPYGSRKRILKKCPGCGALFLYESDYVYLVNGSEDDEYLARLGIQESIGLLREAGMERDLPSQ